MKKIEKVKKKDENLRANKFLVAWSRLLTSFDAEHVSWSRSSDWEIDTGSWHEWDHLLLHWVDKKTLSSKNNFSLSNQSDWKFAAFQTKLAMSKSNRVAINVEWHIMLNHVRFKIIESLEKAIDDVKIIDDSFVLSTIICKTCAFIKTHHVISCRLDQFELTSYLLDRINFDLIFMHCAYNDDQ
jgi:hypothetical protein